MAADHDIVVDRPLRGDRHAHGARDGIDVALEIFRSHRVRCVFATAHYDHYARTRAEAANPLAWLKKPYTMVSLIETITTALKDLNTG